MKLLKSEISALNKTIQNLLRDKKQVHDNLCFNDPKIKKELQKEIKRFKPILVLLDKKYITSFYLYGKKSIVNKTSFIKGIKEIIITRHSKAMILDTNEIDSRIIIETFKCNDVEHLMTNVVNYFLIKHKIM